MDSFHTALNWFQIKPNQRGSKKGRKFTVKVSSFGVTNNSLNKNPENSLFILSLSFPPSLTLSLSSSLSSSAVIEPGWHFQEVRHKSRPHRTKCNLSFAVLHAGALFFLLLPLPVGKRRGNWFPAVNQKKLLDCEALVSKPDIWH